MNDRDELADLYADILFRRHGIETSQSKDVADELIAAGYRKPRTVTTAAELDALPEGSLLIASGTYYGNRGTFTNCHARILPAFVHGTDETVVEVLVYSGSEIAKTITFPATVLHEGGAA